MTSLLAWHNCPLIVLVNTQNTWKAKTEHENTEDEWQKDKKWMIFHLVIMRWGLLRFCNSPAGSSGFISNSSSTSNPSTSHTLIPGSASTFNPPSSSSSMSHTLDPQTSSACQMFVRFPISNLPISDCRFRDFMVAKAWSCSACLRSLIAEALLLPVLTVLMAKNFTCNIQCLGL